MEYLGIFCLASFIHFTLCFSDHARIFPSEPAEAIGIMTPLGNTLLPDGSGFVIPNFAQYGERLPRNTPGNPESATTIKSFGPSFNDFGNFAFGRKVMHYLAPPGFHIFVIAVPGHGFHLFFVPVLHHHAHEQW